MTNTEVLQVLQDLAQGIDPITGSILPATSPYQDPTVIRALFTAVHRLEDCEETKCQSKASPDKSGTAWSSEEDERLVNEFRTAVDFAEIAKLHRRTRGAIVSRLVRLGLVRPRGNEMAASRSDNAHAEPVTKWDAAKAGRAQAGKVWTKAEDDVLLRKFDAGIESAEIAAHLGRGINAVQVRLIKLGRRLPPPVGVLD